MKNKIFAMIMTAVMLFGMTAYAENDKDAILEGEYAFDKQFCEEYEVKDMPAFSDVTELTKELDLPVRLNIISGYEDGTLKLDRTMTRAEAAKMFSYTINDDETIKDIEHQYSKEGIEEAKRLYAESGMEYVKPYEDFSDVTFSGWYYPYVYSAKVYGYISGYEDNTFRPENEVSEIEFLCMLERALGYYDMIEAEGGYPKGVIAISNRLKLIDNPVNAPTTRERAATMLYNALHSYIVTIEGYAVNENGIFERKLANTMALLEHRYLYKMHGTIKESPVLSEKAVVFIPDEDAADYIGMDKIYKDKEYTFIKAYSDIEAGECDVYINASYYEHPVITAAYK